MELQDLVAPSHTAVLTMEMQEGIVGRGGLFPQLVEQVDAQGVRAAVGCVCAAARAAGVRVLHCTAEMRSDGAGYTKNNKIAAMAIRMRAERGALPNDSGQPGALLVPELSVDDRDIVVPRIQGMTPFTNTELDQILRNLGVRTVVATGVSLNQGIFGLCLTAVDPGYQVVLVRDAVAGVPPEFAEAVIEHALGLITTVVETDELVAAWG